MKTSRPTELTVGRLWDMLAVRPETDSFKVYVEQVVIELGETRPLEILQIGWKTSSKQLVIRVK